MSQMIEMHSVRRAAAAAWRLTVAAADHCVVVAD